jgi:nucleotide-binding universal stress UspA family protein
VEWSLAGQVPEIRRISGSANGTVLAVEDGMVKIKRVLCPVDFSETSRHALEHAVAVARWYDSEVFALHVMFPRFVTLPPMFVVPPPPELGSLAERRTTAEPELRRWVAEANGDTVKTQLLFDEGQPAHTILAYASTLPADLLVMGTHGLGGFDRLVLGSVTERVLRKASCAVMTVPPAAATVARVPYTRLLCPVDFSECSLAALRFAFSLAKEADAHVTILHVLDWTATDGFAMDAPFTHRQRLEEEVRQRQLEGLVDPEARVWCKPAIRVAQGKPYRQILEMASAEAIDLIVMGVRGRNAVDLSLFGSTTNHVVRRASVPVLTLHA